MQESVFLPEINSQLLKNLKFYIYGLINSLNQKNITNSQTVYFQFIKNTSKISDVRQLLKNIHSQLQIIIQKNYPELQSAQLSVLAKNQLKKQIQRLIQQEIENQIDKESFSEQIIHPQSFEPSQENGQAVAKVQENLTQKIKWQSFNQDGSMEWSPSNQFISSSKSHQYNASQQWVCDEDKQGSFLYGDKPHYIYDIVAHNGQLYATVSWQKRQNGFLPFTAQIKVEQIKQYYPQMMIQALSDFLDNNQTKAQLEQNQIKSQEPFNILRNYSKQKKHSKAKKIVKIQRY